VTASPAQAAARGRDLPSYVPTFYPIVVVVCYLGLLVVGLGISVFSVTRVFALTTFAVAALSAGINLLMRDRNRGGVLCAIVVFLALFGDDERAAAVLLLVAALVVVERVLSLRHATRVPWRTITLVGNAVGIILILTLIISGIQNGSWGRIAGELTAQRTVPQVANPPAGRPDVYVLLLDGYERPNKMADVLGYDDSPFVRELENRGFEVASNSRSNYLLTALSVPSLLNMRHIADLFVAQPNYDAHYRARLRSFSADNAVFRQMQQLGYETIAVASGFEEVRIRDADRVLDTGQLNEYEIAMARTTALGTWVDAIRPTLFASSQRNRVLATLDAAAALGEEPHDRPLFAFVHVPSPHGPIVFGAKGEHLNGPGLDKFFDDDARDLGLTRQDFARRYVGQVQYLNGLVLDSVDRILAASPTPPVIILLSDHGSGSNLDWLDLDHSDLDERSANLFAAVTPGREQVFPDDITLVNVFGTLLGTYLGTDVARQPDTIYRWDESVTHLIPLTPQWASR
jgi:hypothetical protein